MRRKSVEHIIDIELNVFENNYALLRITDQGKGFDYTQEISSDSKAFRGRGLLMVRNMCDALYFDRQGRRSSAFIRLSVPDKNTQLKTKGVLKYTKQLNLLYVEDNDISRMQFAKIFNDMFKNVYLATNGEEGYELSKRIMPDLIISDHMMPKMTGLELAEKLRRHYPEITFILFTAYDDTKHLIRAIEIGIDRLFQKPIQDFELFKNELEHLSKNIYLKKEMEKRLLQEELQKEIQIHTLRSNTDKYRLEHEHAWKKEKLIIQNDTGMIDSMRIHLHFKPLDILSGDIYGIIKINGSQTLLYILDGMGKGLSASVTSVLSAAFLNRSALKGKEKNDFDFYNFVETFCSYIQPYLLDVETISCHFVHFDRESENLKYIGFGAYPLLLRDENDQVTEIKCKNPPLSRYTKTFILQERALQHSFRLLMYSDGLVEHTEKGYGSLSNHFNECMDFDALKERLEQTLVHDHESFEDDVTLLYVEGFVS
ncbi:MAG: response regulator [Sulfuricurvum sp.]